MMRSQPLEPDPAQAKASLRRVAAFPIASPAAKPAVVLPRPDTGEAANAKREPIRESSQIFLLHNLFEEPESLFDSQELQEYVKEMKLDSVHRQIISFAKETWLWRTVSGFNGAPRETKPHKPFLWKVDQQDVSQLSLPRSREHSGKFEWIGNPSPATTPRYLWDSEKSKTVLATRDMLIEGYLAVSWTWGRFQHTVGGEKQSTNSPDTPWHVPVVRCKPHSNDLVHDLKECLRRVKGFRYFFVDIFCINQDDEREKGLEIAKQAEIFGRADGVLCYLWTLDRADQLSFPLKGIGSLLHWALLFGQGNKFHEAYFKNSGAQPGSSIEDVHRHFRPLRNDFWFSSLWALQEIVLAPAGVWTTRLGHTVTLNGSILTTRLMSLIVRLLSWAEKKRQNISKQAKIGFLKEYDIQAAKLLEIEDQSKSMENLMRARLFEELSKPESPVSPSSPQSFESLHCPAPAMERSSSSPQSLGSSRSDVSSIPLIMSMPLAIRFKQPWILARQPLEQFLRDEIRFWTTWAFGTTSIDVSSTASRAAIIVAGTNRFVVQDNSREAALMAALKLQADDRFLQQRQNSDSIYRGENRRHLSPFLFNILLANDTRQLFNVAHSTTTGAAELEEFSLLSRAWTNGSADLPSRWNAISNPRFRKEYELIEYMQGDRKRHARKLPDDGSSLTDMMPDTAHGLNSQIPHFASESKITWFRARGWHMHSSGALHIPQDTQVQVIKEKSKGFIMFIQPNGTADYPYIIRSFNDMRTVCDSQPWLSQLLGRDNNARSTPKFIFLPLGRASTASATNEDADDIPLPQIGVVLVTKATHRATERMVIWHKFGTYLATAFGFEGLKFKDGILVTSWHDQDAAKADVARTCAELMKETSVIQRTMKKSPTNEFGWETI